MFSANMKLIEGFQIITPIPQIEKMVLRECIRVLNSKIPTCIANIEADIAARMKIPFVYNDEADALVNTGELRAEFGLTQAEAIAALDAVVDAVARSVKVKFKKFTLSGNTVDGGIEVFAIKEDMSDFLSLKEGHVVTKKGQDLPWLEWLLVEGDRFIIADYDIVTSAGYTVNSRSGLAIMVKSHGGLWRVPPQYSGTTSNNWITRAVDAYAGFLESLIAGAIEFNIDKVL